MMFLPNMLFALVLAALGLWHWAAINLAISLIFAVYETRK